MKEIIRSSKAPAPIGPYSQAVKVGNTVYLSGQIALDQRTGEIIDSSIEAETTQVMENIKFLLEEIDATFSHIVKCSIFVKNMDDFQKVNGVYGAYFSADPPARETVEVSGLPKGVRVEISCIVVL